MKFDFCIGNPPYQDTTLGDNGSFAPPVYDKFIDAAAEIADKVELIHPARFLFDAGSTPKNWNEKMLNSKHFKVLHYEENARNIFPNTDIKGGVAITYQNSNETYEPIDVFTPNEILASILQKTKKKKGFRSLSEIVITRTAYHFTNKMHEDFPNAVNQLSNGHAYDVSSNIFERLPQVFSDNIPDDKYEYIKILGREDNQRKYKFIRKDYIKETKNTFKYKVVLPKASGTGKFGEPLSSPIVEIPGNGSTETFITIGAFDNIDEAKNVAKYISTKFCRTMLGILKRTQEITPDKWRFVPLENFGNNSDIDWSTSIKNIDKQLYKKYDLSQEEIDFIETNVKEME